MHSSTALVVEATGKRATDIAPCAVPDPDLAAKRAGSMVFRAPGVIGANLPLICWLVLREEDLIGAPSIQPEMLNLVVAPPLRLVPLKRPLDDPG